MNRREFIGTAAAAGAAVALPLPSVAAPEPVREILVRQAIPGAELEFLGSGGDTWVTKRVIHGDGTVGDWEEPVLVVRDDVRKVGDRELFVDPDSVG